ncbi:MAG TPA: thiamine pyrophosphate-dependent enzyme, partial [Chloroflexota bacterium]|nr:thiamine pyrophosphate-dependent enzyme [Chloroflexota bacterium]
MTGGQALVKALKGEGIDTIFGLPGVQLDWAFDALYEERESIQVVHTRHEQATAYMADGYARTTGRIGVCLVVPGPGLLNTTAALATAYACSSPVLCLTGQINSDLIGLGRGVLHEIPDQLRMIGGVTKWAARATHPTEIPRLVREAFRQLRTGRPRPVELEIPPDILQMKAEVALLAPASVERAAGDPDLIERAAQALGQARQPVIFTGGGVLGSGAWEELRQLAEMLEAPVFASDNGRGAISDRHYLSQPAPAVADLLPSADVILAVGTRFLVPTYPIWPSDANRVVIQLDVDPQEIGRNLKPTIGIVADAKRGLAALIERVARHNRRRDSRCDELTAIKQRWEAEFDSVQPQASLARAIRAELPDDGIYVSESTQVGYWSHVAFPVYQPRSYITSGYQGTLGYGFATALGVQVGNPHRKVVSINGDGGFMFNVQEVSTMVRHKINLVAVVFDDGAFGNVRRIQRDSFGGRNIASDLQNPDFVKLAEAFGVRGIRAEGARDLQVAVREALRANEPALIAVPVPQYLGMAPY